MFFESDDVRIGSHSEQTFDNLLSIEQASIGQNGDSVFVLHVHLLGIPPEVLEQLVDVVFFDGRLEHIEVKFSEVLNLSCDLASIGFCNLLHPLDDSESPIGHHDLRDNVPQPFDTSKVPIVELFELFEIELQVSDLIKVPLFLSPELSLVKVYKLQFPCLQDFT